MTSQLFRSASRATRSLLSASKASRFHSGAAAVVSLRSKAPCLVSSYGKSGSGSAPASWISGALALPAAAYMLQDQEVHAAEFERTFIAIKPDGVQRGLISEIISRFERKGYKLVGIKVLVPSKEFAKKHYHDLSERPFFNELCDFLSSGPVIAMVWEGEGVITYGRKLIGATDPQKSAPGTIRGDLAVNVEEISSMEVMVQKLLRMRLSCGLSQRSWLALPAMPGSGFMVPTEFFFFFSFLFNPSLLVFQELWHKE
ncbi:Nucleoside diphosphate kinase IV/mitochondrial [Arachis hypogaea]|nr:Nucleoside diphosphate kinase IV/mitochondrial [Arachis hypogaea]